MYIQICIYIHIDISMYTVYIYNHIYIYIYPRSIPFFAGVSSPHLPRSPGLEILGAWICGAAARGPGAYHPLVEKSLMQMYIHTYIYISCIIYITYLFFYLSVYTSISWESPNNMYIYIYIYIYIHQQLLRDYPLMFKIRTQVFSCCLRGIERGWNHQPETVEDFVLIIYNPW